MQYRLEVITFICGMVVMIMELCGSRVLAPYVGTSIFVWSSLIAAVLGSLSLGSYIGGMLADRKANSGTLVKIMCFAALCILVTYLIKDVTLLYLHTNFPNIQLHTILGTILLFTPANLFLGMVTPYCTRLQMETVSTAGKTVGIFSAISTLGSIFGTIIAGFYLIPSFGTNAILLSLAVLLIVCSLLLNWQSLLITRVLLIFTLLASANFGVKFDNLVAQFETLYNTVFVSNFVDVDTSRPMRIMGFDRFGYHSAIYSDDDNALVADYLKFFLHAPKFTADPINEVLLIGGGAYIFPRYYFEQHPRSQMDVVEIDPALTQIARQYFNFQDDSRLRIYNEDGRIFLNNLNKKYDAILLDVFGSNLTIPYSMTTRETLQLIHNHLTDSGVVMMNIISPITGDKSQFLQAQYATFASVFPHVLLYPVQFSTEPDRVQNVVLVASKTKNSNFPPPEALSVLPSPFAGEVSKNRLIFTDDYAPVEYLTYQIHQDE
jgi:predicted membrane-bound spermidine synthase